MSAETFLDSNILLYACSSAPDDTRKRCVAEDIILNTSFALSAQVLQEFIANALRKRLLGLLKPTLMPLSKWQGALGCSPSPTNWWSPQ